MKTTILAAAALAIAVNANAQTMGEVLESVERNNIGLKALQKGNEATGLETQTENNLEGLAVEYSPFFNSHASGVASSELVVKQGFDFPTLYGARRKAGRMEREMMDSQYETARRDVLFEAKGICLDLIRLNKQRGLLESRRRCADELLAMFTEKYEGGEATVLELNRVKMDRMNLETELAQAETDRSAALQQLCLLNGGTPTECTDTLYPALPEGSDEMIRERAVSADKTLAEAMAVVRKAEQDVKVNKQGWLPKIEVGYRRNTDGSDASNGFMIGASIPLFANKNKVKTAKARQMEAELKRTEARVKAESDARALAEEMAQLRTTVQAYDVPLMHRTLQLLLTAVANGEISVTDYYAEVDNVYRNLQAYMDVERRYHGVIANLCKNEL